MEQVTATITQGKRVVVRDLPVMIKLLPDKNGVLRWSGFVNQPHPLAFCSTYRMLTTDGRQGDFVVRVTYMISGKRVILRTKIAGEGPLIQLKSRRKK